MVARLTPNPAASKINLGVNIFWTIKCRRWVVEATIAANIRKPEKKNRKIFGIGETFLIVGEIWKILLCPINWDTQWIMEISSNE